MAHTSRDPIFALRMGHSRALAYAARHLRVVVFLCGLGRMANNRRNAVAWLVIQTRDRVGLWVGAGAKGDAMNLPQRARESETFPIAEEESRREREEEARKIRRLQMMMSMVMSVIGQDPNLTIEEASEMAAGAKRAALAMFPDKELAYDLLYKPRLQRLIRERYRLQ
jgi:hypothetical protein